MYQKGSIGILVMIDLLMIFGMVGYLMLNRQLFISNAALTLSSEIVMIDNLKAGTDALMRAKALSEKKKEFSYSYYEPISKAIYTDSQNKVYKYIYEAGGDDSALTFNFYYDKDSRLRFVFINGGASNGTMVEYKIYFDENGARISESHRYIKGPGYTFPQTWPDSKIIFDPIKEFNK
jgi:hypothetical protein